MRASSNELFDRMIERLVDPPILLVMTFRPEFHAPWIGRAGVTLLTLSRLGRRDIASMAVEVASRAIPSELIERIATQTDGVPLFIEELTRSVVEVGLPALGAAARLAVPDTLQASLLARLDRLPAAKTVAQIGAVIGRSFSYELIASVAGLPAPALQEGLAQLVGSELAFARGAPPEASYMFKHSLVRDAAYDSLLRARRALLHGRVAEALLNQSPDAAEVHADLLGYHCAEAGLIEQAIDHWLKAGKSALGRSANIEAISQLQKGVQSLGRLEDDATRRRKEIDLRLALGGAFLMVRGQASPEARDAFSRVRALCQLAGASAAPVMVTWGLWLSHLNQAELAASTEYAEELLHYASDEADVVAKALGHRSMALSMFFQARHSGAVEHLTQTLDLQANFSEDMTNQHGYRVTTDTAHSLLSWALLLQGHVDQALAERRTAVAQARCSNSPNSLTITLHQSCVFYQLLADHHEVEEHCTELIALSGEQGFAHWLATGTIFRGWCIAVRGERDRGLAEMRRGLAAKQAAGAELKVPYYLGLMAVLAGESGEEDATLLFAYALKRIERTGERWFEAELHRLKGEVFLGGAEPSFDQAEVEFQRALAIAREQEAKFWELRAATSLARLWSDQRRNEDARNLLAPVYNWFTEGFGAPGLEEAKALLDELT
jgi:predicted ATPase